MATERPPAAPSGPGESSGLATTAVVPLVVDVDGTLLRSDLLWEGLVAAMCAGPRAWTAVLRGARGGRAGFKHAVAAAAPVDPTQVPTAEPVLALLATARAEGRPVVLASGCTDPHARRLGAHLGAAAAWGCLPAENTTGQAKLARIQAEHGVFDYVGNAEDDLPLWRAARRAYAVHAPPRTLRRLRRARPDAVVLAERPSPWRALARALRPHQWAKNLLLLMPALAAHRPPSAALLATCVLGILAFSAVASAIYVLNDLADLPHDRAHPRKRSRPLASGDLPLAWGVGAVPVLLAIGLAATLSLPPAFGAVVGIYAAASVAYSFDLKRRLLLDVLVLSLLYTLRVVAGAALTGVELSRWFIAFSIFLFFALAAVKRVVELGATVAADSVPLAGRAYRRVDRHTLLALGAAATMTSCLVLCLYITSDEVLQLYGRPDWLWPLLPLLLYWQARLWMFAMRGSLHDDPIVFALGDRVSHLVMVGGLALVWLAR